MGTEGATIGWGKFRDAAKIYEEGRDPWRPTLAARDGDPDSPPPTWWGQTDSFVDKSTLRY